METKWEPFILHAAANDDEWRTIYFALDEYKKKLEETIEYADESPTQHEDEMFCYRTLTTICGIQFAIKEDWEPSTKKIIHRWLDI